MAELKKMGRYELRHTLGQGAMGIVYEGYDPTLSRRVAIKTILQTNALNPQAVQDYSARFTREAKAAARLNHPNIVQVYDFGVEGDIAYLVMEFIQGRELRSFFDQDETFGIEESVRIMCELLDALDFAHSGNVIHRDVKCANVMLDIQRRVKLADFGVARIQDSSDRSQVGTMVGTPAYMSPEQIQGGKIDNRTDIFSSGSILYQFLTGERPFKGAGAWTVAKMIVQDEPPLPSTVASTASPIFDAVVKKALAKDPVRCFQNAKEFSAALREGLKIEFSRTGENRTVALPARSEQRPPAALLPENEVELEYWRSIKDGNDPAEFEIYLKKFPSGEYVDLAKHKVTKLRGGLDASAEQTIVASRPTEQKRNTGLLLVIGVAVAIAGAGIYFVLDKKAKELQIALKAEEEKRVQEQQARVKAEADHKAAAQAIKEKEEARIAAEKAAAEKAVAKKILAEKIAADKLAAERAAAKKAAEKEAVRRQAEKEAQEREAVERAARERAEQERIAAERAAADRAAAERAAAEAAADRAAAQRAAAQRSQADSKMADASYSYSKGLAYASGSGVIQNDFEAVRWYQRAAALNHPGALNNLGVMYQAGRGGLPRDRNEALRLYRRAAAMGNDVARRNAERLEGR